MTNRAAADRYAKALFEVARRESEPQAVERELAAFVGLVRGHDVLSRVLTNPAVPTPRKRAVVAELASRGDLQSVVRKLLDLLAERDRLQILPDLLGAFRQRLLDHLKIAQAEVTTAVPLAADRVEALGRALAAVTGRQVAVTAHVDPVIIGGVVARIGSTVYDGSVQRQLERMRETLRHET
jgi:F-type H+-transporting ATPase subunit delta